MSKKLSEKAKKKAVAYMRYSSDNQSETSIDYQRAAITFYCTQRKIEIVEEYIDEAFSGTNDRRPDFQRLIEDVKKDRDWDMVMVYDMSRFCRNARDAVNYKAMFRDRNVVLVSVTQEFSDTDEGYMFEMMTHVMDELQSRKTGRAARDGMKVKANKAGHCGGIPPLGYNIDDEGKLIINETEAEAVRKIFDMVEMNYSYTRMAEVLNAAGYRTKSGNLFVKNSFSEILRREKYTGTFVWNRARQKDSDSRHNSHAEKPVEKQVRIEGGCPQIITPEQFRSVQELMAERSRGKAASKSNRHYMLSGLKILKCAECGSTMIGETKTSHGNHYTVYICPKHKSHKCSTKEIRTEYIDKMVGRLLTRNLYERTDLDKVSRKMNYTEEGRKLMDKRRGIEKAIANVTKAIGESYSETLIKRLSQLEKEKISVERAMAANSMQGFKITEKNRKRVCNDFGHYLCMVDDPDAKAYLTKMVKEILVSNEEVSVKLNIA